MRVNKKNNDIITCSSVLNHLRSKRVCVFYSLLFLALLEVRTYSRKTTSIDWRDSRRVIFSRFLPRAMVASTVFEADSARCFLSFECAGKSKYRHSSSLFKRSKIQRLDSKVLTFFFHFFFLCATAVFWLTHDSSPSSSKMINLNNRSFSGPSF
jgi:hypothetical protein